MANGLLQLRIDDTLRKEASDVYSQLGLDLPTAIRMFLTRSVQVRGIPFSMILPEEDYKATAAVAAMKRMGSDAEEAGVAPEQIVGADLFLYNRMPGTVWGEGDCYFSAPRLDDLECAAASMEGFLAAEESRGTPIFALFDNEEVGSGTKQGAASTFLTDVLLRLFLEQGKSRADYLRAIANSFMISADNAHAVHPNYADKHDPSNRVYMNSGVVVKHSANQHYTTDAVSDAVFRYLAAKAGVSLQHFHNRSDVAGGSTLGNISGNQVALATVDIGLAQLAMHSPYETAGCSDYLDFIRIARCFYGLRTEARDGGFAFSE